MKNDFKVFNLLFSNWNLSLVCLPYSMCIDCQRATFDDVRSHFAFTVFSVLLLDTLTVSASYSTYWFTKFCQHCIHRSMNYILSKQRITRARGDASNESNRSKIETIVRILCGYWPCMSIEHGYGYVYKRTWYRLYKRDHKYLCVGMWVLPVLLCAYGSSTTSRSL